MAVKKVEIQHEGFVSLGRVELRVHAVQQGGKYPEFEGLATVSLSTGAASVQVYMTPEEMRELASALVAQSWETEA
jgi:hypothetical protein